MPSPIIMSFNVKEKFEDDQMFNYINNIVTKEKGQRQTKGRPNIKHYTEDRPTRIQLTTERELS